MKKEIHRHHATLFGLLLTASMLCCGCGDPMTETRNVNDTPVAIKPVSDSDILQDESIGGIKMGSTETEVGLAIKRNKLGEPSKGKEWLEEATGVYGQTWTYAESGLSLDMSSEEKGGKKSVGRIILTAPSKMKNSLGIGIGSKKADVVEAYANYKSNPEEGEYFSDGDGSRYLVGSIYGGMIFTFEEGKVSKIFLGAASE